MSFTRVNTWGIGDEFTSAQANALALQIVSAVDKSTAGDTLSGPLAFANGGSITANVVGAIVSNRSQGIKSNAANGISSTAALGITATVAGGISSGTDGGIALTGDASDWITYATARSRSIVIPCKASAVGNGCYQMSGVWSNIGTNTPTAYTPTPAGTGFVTSGAGYAYILDLSPWMHDGSTVLSAVLNVTIGTGHTSLPSYGPGFGIYRSPAAGVASQMTGGINATTLCLASPQSLYPLPGTVSAYNGQTFTVNATMNTGTVLNVDKSSYSYFAILYDEFGGGASGATIFNSITLNQNNITSNRPG